MSTKQKIVITGGAGFVGSHLSRALIEKGFTVHIIDNLISGNKSNLHQQAIFHKVDIRDYKKILPILSGASFVFHLAALPNVEYSIQNPEISHDTNVNGTLNVYRAATEAKVRKVIFASSCSVYGNYSKKMHEKLTPKPQSPYALHKLIGEQYAKLWFDLYKLNIACLRFFNIYGPGQRDTGPYAFVIAIFLKLKSLGKPLTITGNGQQTRDFIHISDVVSACIKAMKAQTIPGQAINIGSGKEMSVNKIAKMIGGPIVHLPKRIEPPRALADNSLAFKLLNWKPSISPKKGIEELLFL